MADLDQEKRSKIMRAIRSKDTKPELYIRRLLHSLGYRFRIHQKELPGNPDIVFSKRRKVIFVHGCFWHQHEEESCRDSHAPKANSGYWAPKLARTKERDAQAQAHLEQQGWSSLVIWECELKNKDDIKDRLLKFLGDTRTIS